MPVPGSNRCEMTIKPPVPMVEEDVIVDESEVDSVTDKLMNWMHNDFKPGRNLAPRNTAVSADRDSSAAALGFGLLHFDIPVDDHEPVHVPPATPGDNPQQLVDLMGSDVVLHVYHVSTSRVVEAINMLALPLGAGAFHVGIEVHGKEWSYGIAEQGSGLCWIAPRTNRKHLFCESVRLGRTSKSSKEVLNILFALAKRWRGIEYDIFRSNCCHFARDFAKQLGVADAYPSWVDRLCGSKKPQNGGA
eukprot:gnl/TRDRNA2_/TRDRNA2_82414_c0_seq1.p1 gnl/TRDRNA2_/TRDRNA2_82414_c0~~gnl/TRDRNA2_/TRDRNA2_82414_c0_seq1.p1  ORF type:complete len:270 (+),score=31.36 gnl/TRDRNA2_/TRDRNA2_82414_c0_seq1:71-811(+)